MTTEITGEGTSIAPLNDRVLEDFRPEAEKYHVDLDWRSLDEYFKHFQRARPAINLGTFVGAGGLREYVIGKDNRPATPAELEQMRQLIAQAMQQEHSESAPPCNMFPTFSLPLTKSSNSPRSRVVMAECISPISAPSRT